MSDPPCLCACPHTDHTPRCANRWCGCRRYRPATPPPRPKEEP